MFIWQVNLHGFFIAEIFQNKCGGEIEHGCKGDTITSASMLSAPS